jgi:hypothetical protein
MNAKRRERTGRENHPVREARPPLLRKEGSFFFGARFPRSKERGNLEECGNLEERGNLEKRRNLQEFAI